MNLHPCDARRIRRTASMSTSTPFCPVSLPTNAYRGPRSAPCVSRKASLSARLSPAFVLPGEIPCRGIEAEGEPRSLGSARIPRIRIDAVGDAEQADAPLAQDPARAGADLPVAPAGRPPRNAPRR